MEEEGLAENAAEDAEVAVFSELQARQVLKGYPAIASATLKCSTTNPPLRDYSGSTFGGPKTRFLPPPPFPAWPEYTLRGNLGGAPALVTPRIVRYSGGRGAWRVLVNLCLQAAHAPSDHLLWRSDSILPVDLHAHPAHTSTLTRVSDI